MTSIRARLQAELSEAARARDGLRLSVLRTTLSAIGNAEAVEVPAGTTATELPRRSLTEEDLESVVAGERNEIAAAAAEARAHGRPDAAAELEAQVSVLAALLGGERPEPPAQA